MSELMTGDLEARQPGIVFYPFLDTSNRDGFTPVRIFLAQKDPLGSGTRSCFEILDNGIAGVVTYIDNPTFTTLSLMDKDPSFAGRFYRSIAAILAERLRLTSMHLDTLIEGIDFYSQTRAEIEAAAAKLPGMDWRTDLVSAMARGEPER